MNVKRAVVLVGLGVLLFAMARGRAAEPAGRIALTFDDLPLNGPERGLEVTAAVNRQILAQLKRAQAPAVGFVNEEKLYRKGEIDSRIGLLDMWLEAGAELGNHTFSHPSINDTSFPDYRDDVIRGETVTKWLLMKRGQKLAYFRHPFLRTGLTVETKDALASLLAERGYRVAPVTVENSDWAFNSIYVQAKIRGDEKTLAKTAQDYLAYSKAELEFFEKTAQTLFGRAIAHVLLLHANELNADHLGELLELLRDAGYRFIPLAEALQDPAYDQPDPYVGPAGVNWLYRWDLGLGRRIDWKSEPEPPRYVLTNTYPE